MTLTSASGAAAVDVAVDVAVSLPAQPDSVPRARRYVRRHVPGLDGELRERAEQVVTELVGDLLPHHQQHPDGRLLLRIAARGGTVRLVVQDGSAGPHDRASAPGGAGGWRWALVVALSERHGVDADGTTLWCELDADRGRPAPGAPLPAAPAAHTTPGTPGTPGAEPAPPAGLVALLGDGAVTFEQACSAVLDHLQENVPMGYWAVTRHDGDRQVYVHVRDEVYGTRPGDGHDWDASFCKRMVAGAPAIAPDVMAVPAYAGAGVSRLLRIGSYVAVPLVGADGHLFGTVCGLDPAVRDDSLTRHAPLLQLLGTLLSALLQREQVAVQLHQLAGWTRREAETDVLTGLANRRGWQRLLTEREHPHRGPACVAVLDLDGLKQANDTLGHGAGDDLLRRTAEVLRGELRGRDALARLGGDEFGVVMPGTAAPEAQEVVERLRSALRSQGIAASAGVGATGPAGGLVAAWERADRAMYADKRRHGAGRGPGELGRGLGAASWVSRPGPPAPRGSAVPALRGHPGPGAAAGVAQGPPAQRDGGRDDHDDREVERARGTAEADQRGDEGGERELQGPQQGRGGAGGARHGGQRERGAVAHHQAQGGDRGGDGQGEPARGHVEEDEQQQRRGGQQGGAQPGGEQALDGEAAREAGGGAADHGEQQGVDAEHQAVLDLAQAHQVLVQERRGGDVGHHHGEAEGEGEGVADVRARAQVAGGGAGGGAQLARRGAAGRRVRLAHDREDGDEHQHREGQDDGEDAAPADGADEQAAGERGDDRGQAADDHQQAQGARGGGTGDEVGDDGAADDHARRATQALRDAGGDEHAHRGGEDGERAGEHAEHGTGDEGAHAAEAVRQRAEDELAGGGADEEGGQRQLHAGLVGAEVTGHLGEGGQVQVGGEGGDREEQGEHEQQTAGEAAVPLDGRERASAGEVGGSGSGCGHGWVLVDR